VAVAFFVAALGEYLVQVEEEVAGVQGEMDRKHEVLVPLEQLVAGWQVPCCDDTPCEHQDHV